ncbi:MAG: cell division protein ZapA [Rickettsiales bacterium]
MAIVGVKINGREYHLACDDGQEEQLRVLADEVDERVRDLVTRMGGNTGEVMGLLLAAITMADELIENKKEIERLSSSERHFPTLTDGEPSSGTMYTEDAVATTLEEIAQRIEKIAERIEIS